jgi:hypothetical protein
MEWITCENVYSCTHIYMCVIGINACMLGQGCMYIYTYLLVHAFKCSVYTRKAHTVLICLHIDKCICMCATYVYTHSP